MYSVGHSVQCFPNAISVKLHNSLTKEALLSGSLLGCKQPRLTCRSRRREFIWKDIGGHQYER